MDYVDPKKINYLPNTAGCFNSKMAFKNSQVSQRNWRMENS